MSNSPIPVILDTDLGTDIDDTWALALLLRSPELDLRLVTTATGDTAYRAKIAARLLEIAGRAEVPLAAGRPWGDFAEHQLAWVRDYDLAGYRAVDPRGAAAAIVESVMTSAAPVTIIAIGPLTNIGDALALEPRIAERARFVGMQGSLRVNYNNAPGAVAEWNVQQDVQAARRTFTAPWPKTITPLDTCGSVSLQGDLFAQLSQSNDPLLRSVLENYNLWRVAQGQTDLPTASSILYDTVAVHLAHTRRFLTMEELGICITDDGYTVEDVNAPRVECATAWADYPGFLRELVTRLMGDPV